MGLQHSLDAFVLSRWHGCDWQMRGWMCFRHPGTLVGFRFLLGSMLFKERDDVLSLLYLNTFRAIFIVIRLTQTHRRVCNVKIYYCRTIMRLVTYYGWSTNPAKRTPRRNMALLRAYEPLVSLDKALLNPFFWGWYVGGGDRLTSHEYMCACVLFQQEPTKLLSDQNLYKFYNQPTHLSVMFCWR